MADNITWFVQEFLRRNLTVTVVILVVLMARLCMKRLPKKCAYVLWAVVGLRMIVSFQINSPFSIFSLVPWAEPQKAYVEVAAENGAAEVAAVNTPLTVQADAAKTWPAQSFEIGERAGMKASDDAAAAKWQLEENIGGRSREPSSETLNDLEQKERFTERKEEEKTDAGEDVSQVTQKTAWQTPWEICFFVVWLTGLLAVLGTGAVSYLRTSRRVKEAVLLQDNVWECDYYSAPFVLGIFRPRIYVPFRLEEERRRWVLAHEQCHVRRGDPFVRLLAYLLLAAYWCNPFVWLAYVCFIRDQEMSCDEAVLSNMGEEQKIQYGMTLLSFATDNQSLNFSPLAFGESDAKKRIKNILNYKKPTFWVMAAGIVLVVVIGVICLTTRKDQGEDPGKNDPARVAEGQGNAGKEAGNGTKEQTDLAFGERTQTINADLDGDGTPEAVSIKNEPSGKTVVQVNLQGDSTAEITLQSVDMISTRAKAADVDNDGKEELILLESSPLGSSYNWPGKLTVLRLHDGKWEPLSDQLTYGSYSSVQYEEAYPKSLSEGAFISVKVEKVLGTVEVRFVRPIFVMDGRERFVCLDCHYESTSGGRWAVDRISTIQPPLGTGALSYLQCGITVGNRPVIKDMEVKPDQTVFSKLTDEFLFASGAGGWQTTLSVKADGSFTGKYLDADVSADDRYDTEFSICEFTGKCSAPYRLNQYAYGCRLEEISYPEPGETYVKDRFRFMTAEPYGLDKADELIIYLPGCPVSELPCEVDYWIQGSADWSWYADEPDVLPFYIIYNIDGGEAFTSPTLPEYQGRPVHVGCQFFPSAYPAWNGGVEFKTAYRLCADVCGAFLYAAQTKMQLLSEEIDYMPFIAQPRLVRYLKYEAQQFPYALSQTGSWHLIVTKDEEEWLEYGDEKILHLQGILRHEDETGKTEWGYLHFLIGIKDGQHVIRDWYWDCADSADENLRGPYSAGEFIDYWENPEKYGKIMDDQGKMK